MNYLHSLQPPVIHSDLKSENILVSDKLVAKVSSCVKFVVSHCSKFCHFYLRVNGSKRWKNKARNSSFFKSK